MCNILELTPGVMLDRDAFDTMCYNNWHSYGVVTFRPDGMSVIKHVPESGEIDPAELWAILEAEIDHPRIVHVRHTTAGTTSLNNCHPFTVFEKDGREVLFMHNGTMHQFKSKKWVKNEEYTPTRNYTGGGGWEDDDTGPSDTMNFATEVLTPYLSSMNVGNGTGDYSNNLFKAVLMKFWPPSNRGVLMANDQTPFFFGEWKTVTNSEGKEIKTSNTDYFKEIKRGPEFQRIEARRKLFEEAEKAKQAAVSQNTTKLPAKGEVIRLSDYSKELNKKLTGFELKGTLANILTDHNVWDRDAAVMLGMATHNELEQIYHDKQVCLQVMDWIFADYGNLYDEMAILEDVVEELRAEMKTNVRKASK